MVIVFGQEDDAVAAAAISEAENSLVFGFEDVLEAEYVGADISGLLERLDEAGVLLADAKMHYRNGNYSGAVYFAELVSGSLVGLEDEAVGLANSVAVERGQMISWIVAGSVVGFCCVAFIGLWGWGYVRDLYIQKVLEMKPEVKEDDKH